MIDDKNIERERFEKGKKENHERAKEMREAREARRAAKEKLAPPADSPLVKFARVWEKR